MNTCTFRARISRSLLAGSLALTQLLFPGNAGAIEAILTDDVSVSTAPGARPARADAQSLAISETNIVYLKFDIASVLPANTTADRVEKATLRLWVQRIPPGGAGMCYAQLVTSPWGERTPYPYTFLNGGRPAEFEGPYYGAQGEFGKNFIVIDVTEIVRKWLSGTANLGIALRGVRSSPSFIRPDPAEGQRPLYTPLKATLDSKESVGTGHAPMLQLVLKNAS